MTDTAVAPDTGAEPIAPAAAPEPIEDRTDIPGEVAPRSTQDIVADILKDLPDEWDTEAPPAADPAERDEGGRFKGKDKPDAPKDGKPEEAPQTEGKTDPPAQVIAAPERFNAEAKAAWDALPDPVKHETLRMQRELENGLSEYRAKVAEAEARYEPLREYREMADQAGIKFEDALSNYVAAEKALHENPAQALTQMAQQYMPGGVEALIRAWTGQALPQDAQNAELHQLRQQVAQLTQQAQAHAQMQAQTREVSEREALLTQFAAANPRVAEPAVEAEMARLIVAMDKSIPPQERLSQAYQVATRLIPVVLPEPAPQPDPVQTRAQALSVTGAPASGSNPRYAKPAANPQEAVSRAFDQLGFN